MRPDDRRKLERALVFALDAHAGQTRKGKPEVPYASHLLAVAGLLLEYGRGDVDLAVAGLLHDTLEDCDVRSEEIAEAFGDLVARIVEDCTDLLEGDSRDAKSPWRERKQRYLDALPGKPLPTRLVAACDKLHNLTNLVADVRAQGASFLDRFNAGIEDQLWYHETLAERLGDDLPAALRLDLRARVRELRELAGGR